MTGSNQRQQWQPAPRPDWVQRINEEGYCMDISGVVPLDEQSLITSAMRATGLSDFGADDWHEPFQVLVKALEEESRLNLMGRLRTRSELLQLLEARLQIEDWYKRHPEIADEEIVEPLIVVGQGRSGTSFLINTLAAHPENGVLRHWEVVFPCPPPEKATYETDSRIEKADKVLKQWNRVNPEYDTMHEWGAQISMECLQLVAISFQSAAWLGLMGQVPSYEAYMAQRDFMPALHYFKRALKLLQWRNPRKRWVLKDVFFLGQMPNLLKVFPDARFVWPHRDPTRALASMVNVIGSVQWGRSDYPFSAGSFEFATDPQYSAMWINGVIDQIENGSIPRDRICHIQYHDLIRDPLATIEGIYRHFDMPLSEVGRRAMEQYLADNPRDARPPHRFSLGSDELVARTREVYRRYQEFFSVPNEF